MPHAPFEQKSSRTLLERGRERGRWVTVAKAKALRTNATDAERVLWHRLRAHRLLGYKFRRQQPMGHYIVDFVCFETQMIVEVDGGQHSERVLYDRERTLWLEAQGFRVLRFWNHEVRKHLEAVTETILRECSRATPSPWPSPTCGPPWAIEGEGKNRRRSAV